MVQSIAFACKTKFSMKTQHLIIVFLASIFFGCQNENPIPAPPDTLEHPQLAEIEATVEAALAELEADYNAPPSEEGLSSRSAVYVPAGSMNAVQDAIAEAGPNGKVILESGNHYESGTITITQKVTLRGEDGAKLYVDVAGPGDAFPFPTTNVLDPAIYIKDCNLVRIENLSLRSQGEKGSTGIFLEKGRLARIQDCDISNFQFGIWASDNSNMVRIYDNEIDGYDGLGVWGIIIESGRYAKVKGNKITRYAAGIFASDIRGTMTENETDGGSMGPLLCTVQGNVMLPNGEMLENATPCKDWVVSKNIGRNSLWNYVVIDGANNNFLYRNESYDPVFQDIILLGESYLTGQLTPTSYKNFVVNLADIETKDCGLNNVVLGGTKTDTELDPCF